MTANEFWERFLMDEAFLREELSRADTYASQASEAFVLALRNYSEGLGFIHYKKNHKHILIITAGGSQQYFLAATYLVEQAPKLLNWEMQALIPPLKKYSETYLNNEIELDTIPITIKHLKGAVTCYMDDEKTYGLTFLLPFIFKNRDQDKICEDLGTFVEDALGERRCSERICYIDVGYQKEDHFEYTTIDQLDAWMKSFDAAEESN